jgi:hypothetical protein
MVAHLVCSFLLFLSVVRSGGGHFFLIAPAYIIRHAMTRVVNTASLNNLLANQMEVFWQLNEHSAHM